MSNQKDMYFLSKNYVNKDDTINVTYKPEAIELSLFTQGAKRAVVNGKEFDIPSGKEYLKSK